MHLSEIVIRLGKYPGVHEDEAYFELSRLGAQHPDLEFVRWYTCKACRESHGGSRECASPFVPEECLQMFDDVEPEWVPLEWEEMKRRGIRKGDAHLG